MKTTDFNLPVTSKRLAENLEKQFGNRVNLNRYNREQLEDMRNKLRTRVFQQEGSAGINDLLTNETYQKDKAMLELLNTRIKEMLGEQMQKLRDKIDALNEGKKGVKVAKHPQGSKMAKKDYDGDGKVETGKDEVLGSRAKAAAKAGHPFKESAKPDFLDMDKDGNKKEPMKKAAKDAKVKEGFPTIDSAKAAHAEREKNKGTGKFDKQTTTTGTKYTRKSDTFDNGTEDKPKEKKVKEAEEKCSECGMYENKCKCVHEGDMGKHNNATTGFKALAKKAGGGEKGKKIAGAQFQKMKKAGQLKESQFKHNVRFVNESLQFLLAEDEEGKAKAITAAGDMVNDFTGWMQRVGQYQTKSMIELADAIKADFGPTEAEAFKAAVAPALSATLEVLTQQREAISGAVAVLAGEAAPEAPMGMEPEMDSGMDMSAPDEMNPEPAGDEFAAADAAAGGAETSGRAMRESKFARRLAESHSIMSKLAK
jgi:hypothetical protein